MALPETVNADWAVARTVPARERTAREHSARQGFQSYLPTFVEERAVRGRRVEREALLFPGYLFFAVRDGQPWSPMRSTRGVIDLVYCGGQLALSRGVAEAVARLKASEDERGYVVLEARAAPARSWREGEHVTVSVSDGYGSTSIPGIYRGTAAGERVRVLLRIMGGWVPGVVEERALAAA